MKISQTKDLAEQYLVSCNSDGWGCNGGWFAHDYHWNKKISGEPDAGAVYESDFPYRAIDVACNPPHTHQEKLTNWNYVNPSNPDSVASVDAIKQAIYTYGPVSAAICVDWQFQMYTSGVFSTNEYCGSDEVNHAIVLVGWDDSQGVWYLRNSWGPSWGESGYMRIKYNTSNVGYAASYVSFSSLPTLTVSKAGNGFGTVASSPSGIDCGTDCSETYASGTAVTLTATPTTDSTFTGWSGACSGTGSYQVTMSQARTVTATFKTDKQYTLTVSKTGTGSGAVISSPAGISCGVDCSETYTSGTVVKLTAMTGVGSQFAGWGGACGGTGSCQVTMSQAQTVMATFNIIPTYTLTVSKTGTGRGAVISSPAGISCGADCSETCTSGTVVWLTAMTGSGPSLPAGAARARAPVLIAG